MNKPPKITEHEVSGETIKVWHPGRQPGFCISHGDGGWMPGVFDSVEAALLGAAACFEDESRFVLEIQYPINSFDKQYRLININDLNGKDTNE